MSSTHWILNDAGSVEVFKFDDDDGEGKAFSELVNEWLGRDNRVQALTLTPDRTKLIVATHKIGVWDIATHTLVAELGGHSSSVTSVQVTPDGQYLVLCDWWGRMHVWDLPGAEEVGVQEVAWQDLVMGWHAVPGTEQLLSVHHASINGDHRIRVWSLHQDRIQMPREWYGWSVAGAINQAGRALVYGSSEESGVVWDFESGEEVVRCSLGEVYDVSPLCVAPDGRWMAFEHSDKTVRLWWPDTGVTEVLREAGSQEEFFAFPRSDSSGLVLAPRRSDGNPVLEVWTVKGDISTIELDDRGEVMALTAMPDGQHTIVGRSDGTIEVRTLDGALRSSFSVSFEPAYISALAVSPCGRFVAVGDHHSLGLHVWDLTTCRQIAAFATRTSVGHVIFATDRRIVCSDAGWVYDLQLEMPPGAGA